MTQDKFRSLDGIAMLDPLSRPAREALEKKCNWHDFAPHEQVIDRASDTHDVYFVVRGTVRVVNYSYSGREVSYDDIGAGGLFGELAAIDGAPRSANVVALDETTVAIVSPEVFIALLQAHPDFAFAIMKRLVQIVRGSTDRIMDLSTMGAPHRIHAELLRMARPLARDDDSAVIRPIPVHAEIASRAGTTRETVARAFGDLARQGIIRRESNALVIPDVARLEELVEDV